MLGRIFWSAILAVAAWYAWRSRSRSSEYGAYTPPSGTQPVNDPSIYDIKPRLAC